MLLAPDSVLIILGAVLVLWLGGLTLWVQKTVSHYTHLIGKTGNGDLRKVLETLLEKTDITGDRVNVVHSELSELSKRTEKHLQKIGLVKFNPFGDTGGNQSFAFSMLNAESSGIVILSLHGREGTRVYIKNITRGKSAYDLSKEEKKAIEEAK